MLYGDRHSQIDWHLRKAAVRGFAPSLACVCEGACLEPGALASGQSLTTLGLTVLALPGSPSAQTSALTFAEFHQGLPIEALLPVVTALLGRHGLDLGGL